MGRKKLHSARAQRSAHKGHAQRFPTKLLRGLENREWRYCSSGSALIIHCIEGKAKNQRFNDATFQGLQILGQFGVFLFLLIKIASENLVVRHAVARVGQGEGVVFFLAGRGGSGGGMRSENVLVPNEGFQSSDPPEQKRTFCRLP